MSVGEFQFHLLKQPGTIGATPIGLGFGITLDGDGLTSKDEADASWLEHRTKAGAGSAAGLLTRFDVVASGWRPVVEFELRTPADLSALRLWVGLFAVRPDGLAAPQPGQELAAFHFEAGVSSAWRAAVGNATTTEVQALGTGALPPGTVQLLKLLLNPGKVLFFVGGALAHTSAIGPSVDRLLGLGVRVTTLAARSKAIEWRRVSWNVP